MKTVSLRARRRKPRKATVIDEAIGRQIRKRRRMLDISQVELAHRIGVAPQQVQKYECGINRLSVSRLVEVAQALDAPVGWFFRGINALEPRGAASPAPAEEEVLAAVLSALAEPAARGKLFAIATQLQAADGRSRRASRPRENCDAGASRQKGKRPLRMR